MKFHIIHGLGHPIGVGIFHPQQKQLCVIAGAAFTILIKLYSSTSKRLALLLCFESPSNVGRKTSTIFVICAVPISRSVVVNTLLPCRHKGAPWGSDAACPEESLYPFISTLEPVKTPSHRSLQQRFLV